MTNVHKAINTAKKLIDLPYNEFNLDNYRRILEKKFKFSGRKLNGLTYYACQRENQPVKLMAGNHPEAQCIHTFFGRHVYIVGKGILFDSGGLDLKKEMYTMTNDKAGMIIALAVTDLLPDTVTAYCPVTTNFLQTSKIIPGDIITIGEKKVKIINTDAEGRLILAEALSQLDVGPKDIVITVATLTGACAYAVGTKATAYMTENDKLAEKFAKASDQAKELSWRLPLWDYLQKKYYKGKLIKNYEKDIKNGTTEAAMFVKQFVKYPNQWIHLDIAYSAFNDNGKANGIPIRSLINFIKKINQED